MHYFIHIVNMLLKLGIISWIVVKVMLSYGYIWLVYVFMDMGDSDNNVSLIVCVIVVDGS